MELAEFSADINRMLDNPSSVTVRQGMEFATRLHNFLLQKPAAATISAPLWSGKDSNDSSVSVEHQGPQIQFMKQFERILLLGIEEMRRDLLEAMDCSGAQEGASADSALSQRWQILKNKFLEPMNRLNAFSRVIQACLIPMRQWLSDSVLIGHRRLCLADLIRQLCLDHFLKRVAPRVTVLIFNSLHVDERNWEAGDLQPVNQFVSLIHKYQRFQNYLTREGYRTCLYDQWEGGAEADREMPPCENRFNVDNALVEPYLDCLKDFYRPRLDPFDSNTVARSVSDWLMTEELLAVSFGVQGFRDAVVNCVLHETVKTHLTELGDTVMRLLIDSDSQGLSLFFSVIVIVDGGQDHLLEVIRRFVKDKMLQVFDGIKEEFRSLDPNSAKATSMYVEACVSQLRHCKAIIEATIELQQPPSLSRSLLLGTVRAGIADVLNGAAAGGGGSLLTESGHHRHHAAGGGYPAAALAHHFHRQMRSARRLDAGTEETLGDLMTLYSLLEDKEAFMLRYHSLLRERLLSDASDQLSLDVETFALDSFTQLSGWKALYEVKSVLKDFRESENFNVELREQAEYRDLQLALFGSTVPVRFTFVRGYFWRIAAESVRLPRQLAPLAVAAIRAYESRHSGRTVSLAHSYGSGLLAFSPRRRQLKDLANKTEAIQLRCSAAVMLLLLHCDELSNNSANDGAEYLTESQLQLSTGIKPNELAFYLHHLTRAGLLLTRTDGDQEVELDTEDDVDGAGGRRLTKCYTINDEFDSDAKQVNLMVVQQQQAQKQRRRLEKLDQRMKEKKVQCAMVTTMKQRRQLTRKNLFQLVQDRLQHLTVPTAFLSEQLAYLISGGYMKFAEEEESNDKTDDCVIEYIP